MMKKITISREIYSENNIKDAIKSYKDLAIINLSTSSSYIELRFTECKYEEARTIKEFENYLIGLENTII